MAKRKAAEQSTEAGQLAVGDRIQAVAISQETRRRYLNYAMSVITSRALPDVRDGLKPVQRRILYVMYEGLGLTATTKPRKCAKICGDTTGNFHPHGEQAVYESLVRLAQDFSLRHRLVDGQGNFGSIMGLPAAASRYTEARLTSVAEQLLNELRFQTVDYRPNYDNTQQEPLVLPARFPNLLVNGASGIAVGMATNIPPHHLGEVIKACVTLIGNPEATVAELMKSIKGPDFPLGGRIMTDRKELRTMYEEGRGSVKVRGEWRFDKDKQGEHQDRLVIYSMPFGVETGPLVAEIGAIVVGRKLPQLVDVADETDERNGLRIVLDLKPGSDPEAVMAYLYKHTALEQNFAYNSTCLVPDEHGALIPARLNLVEMCRHFLTFRLKTVRRRFEYQLRILERRIHILEGFAIVFNDLDKAIRIIRNSQGKKDASEKLMKAFPLDEEQTAAILELQLYRISQLEIHSIREELAEKQAEAERIRKILASEKKLWGVVETELNDVAALFPEKRRSSLGSADEITEFDPQAYIVRENANVVLSRDGWIKRVGRLQSVESTRVREGDRVLDVVPGSTLDNVVFFASDGAAYTLPITEVPASSGYGEPISKHFKLRDGVQVVAALSTDPRFTPADEIWDESQPPTPYLLVATLRGQVMQIPLSPFRTVSTKSGRRYCRVAEGDRVIAVARVVEQTSVFLASKQAKLLHFAIEDVPVLSGAGKGVRGMRLDPKDELLGLALMGRPSDVLRVKMTNDKEVTFGQMKYAITSRGGKGIRTSQRNGFAEIISPPIELVDWNSLEAT